MSLLSFSEFKQNIKKAHKRFPLPIALAAIFSISAIIGTELSWGSEIKEDVFGLTLTALLLYPLSIGIITLFESAKAKLSEKVIANSLLIMLFGISYFFWFRNYDDWTTMQMLMTGLWGIASVLFVFVSPYIFKGKKMEDFWQYATRIAGRVILTGAFFTLMFIGIAILLASVDYLFAFSIHEELYPDIFFILSGITGQLFFLSGIPEKYDGLEKSYPAGLKFVIQYLFVPLIIAYLIVLYLYTGSIVLTWEWPKGGVAAWVIVFCTSGVFTYFFSHSLKEIFYKYVDIFRAKLFYFIIPLTIVLFFAVGIRIADYGVTEARYFGVIFGAWLLGISIYYIFSKVKDLRFFPTTLIILILLSSYGPVSAFTISKNSQIDTLSGMLEASESEDGEFTAKEELRIKSIVSYLLWNHGIESLGAMVGDIPQDEGMWELEQNIFEELGLDRDYEVHTEFEITLENENRCFDCAYSTKGHEYYREFYISGYDNEQPIGIYGNRSHMEIVLGDEEIKVVHKNIDVLDVSLKEYFESEDTMVILIGDKAVHEFTSDHVEGELVILDANLSNNKIQSLNGYILFTEK